MLGQVLFGIAMYFSALITDWVWARWSMATSDRHASWGAFWAACIVLCSLVSLNAYLQSYWYVIPLAAGVATGTFLSVKHKR